MIGLLALPACAVDPPATILKESKGPLPIRSEAYVKSRMADLLRELGDLSAYVVGVDANGTIVLTNVEPPPAASPAEAASAPGFAASAASCTGTEINPTIRLQVVIGDRLSNATRGVEAFNAALARQGGVSVRVAPKPYYCVR